MPKLYTGAGDRGETSLFGGGTVDKTDPRVEAFGVVDELNSAIGVARSFIEDEESSLLLSTVQNRLFNLGAELATESEKASALPARISAEDVSWIEAKIDSFGSQLPPLKGFIIPGGTRASSLVQLARAICRRAERAVVALKPEVRSSEQLVPYLNRLSDLLFVLARYINFRARQSDERWLKDKPD
ncbi:MAG: ATP:cob(I)alamin adenosyltransferase [Planctomycetales bacterium 4484_113]|nr:MAG: ATP:cob(I)alamin adenosyltransferase [Planctomycetales bacterium 4484_113]